MNNKKFEEEDIITEMEYEQRLEQVKEIVARKRMPIREWVEHFKNGDYSSSFNQRSAGWYDWFCDEDELPSKLCIFAEMLLSLKSDNSKIDIDNSYVQFHNGNYDIDTMIISDINTEKTQMMIEIIRFKGYTIKVVSGDINVGTLFESDSKEKVIEWLNK